MLMIMFNYGNCTELFAETRRNAVEDDKPDDVKVGEMQYMIDSVTLYADRPQQVAHLRPTVWIDSARGM
jgi:hypothetical protein